MVTLAPEALTTVGTVFAYLTGVAIRAILEWKNRGTPSKLAQRIGDLKALIVLVALAVTATAFMLDRPQAIPEYGFRLWRCV